MLMLLEQASGDFYEVTFMSMLVLEQITFPQPLAQFLVPY